MIQVSNFCCRCGCSLRSGSIVISICTVVLGLALLTTAVGAALGGSAARSAAEGESWATRARARGLDEGAVQRFLHEAFYAAPVTTRVQVLLNLVGVTEAFHVNFSILLFYGILKKRLKLVSLWVKYSIVALILRFLFLTVIAIILMCSEYEKMGGFLLFLPFALTPLAFYFILVVNSYHEQLKRQEALRLYASEWQT